MYMVASGKCCALNGQSSNSKIIKLLVIYLNKIIYTVLSIIFHYHDFFSLINKSIKTLYDKFSIDTKE